MTNNNGEKGYYPVVNINEGSYYEIDLPFSLLKVRELNNKTVSRALDEELPDGIKRYELFISNGVDLFHPYINLTNKEYKVLQDSIGDLVRITTYNIVGADIMFAKAIKIEIDGGFKTVSFY